MVETPCESTPHGCQIGELFRMLSKAHMLDILHVVIKADEPIRFIDIQDRLMISPNTLSNRLKAMHDAGLVTRTAYPEVPPRVEYEATDKARALRTVFGALNDWASQYDLKPLVVAT